MRVRAFICAVLVVLSSFVGFAEESSEVYVVSAAGYKLPVSEVIAFYEKEKPQNKINAVFGNMKMITTYVSQSDLVSLIVGDSGFIKKSGIRLEDSVKIGEGKLLLVYQPDYTISSVEDLTSSEIKRIGIPDPKKAIYGKAAVELLKAVGIYEKVKDKLIILKTVPQVSSYLKSGDIDVGLINVTDYVKLKNLGLESLNVDPDLYSKIVIQAGLINGSGMDFLNFIASDQANYIFKKYGL